MGEVQKVKQQLTGATTSIENARKIVDAMATQVRAQLAHIETLLEAAEAEEDGEPRPVGASAPAAADLRLEV